MNYLFLVLAATAFSTGTNLCMDTDNKCTNQILSDDDHSHTRFPFSMESDDEVLASDSSKVPNDIDIEKPSLFPQEEENTPAYYAIFVDAKAEYEKVVSEREQMEKREAQLKKVYNQAWQAYLRSTNPIKK